MSAYLPPTENLPVFNSLVFSSSFTSTSEITFSFLETYLSANYLKFPTAQNIETFPQSLVSPSYYLNNGLAGNQTIGNTQIAYPPIPTTLQNTYSPFNDSPFYDLTTTLQIGGTYLVISNIQIVGTSGSNTNTGFLFQLRGSKTNTQQSDWGTLTFLNTQQNISATTICPLQTTFWTDVVYIDPASYVVLSTDTTTSIYFQASGLQTTNYPSGTWVLGIPCFFKFIRIA